MKLIGFHNDGFAFVEKIKASFHPPQSTQCDPHTVPSHRPIVWLLIENFNKKIKVDEEELASIKENKLSYSDVTKRAVIDLAKDIADEVCDVISDQPWKGFVVSVSDTGPGIPEEQQRIVFDEFQQVDSSSTRKKGGTGLGLTISKRIVELHGGDIWLESALGKGSTFTFSLPINATAREAVA